MLKVLERDYKQKQWDIIKEFPDSKFVMRVDDVHDTEGYLMAVSTSQESSKEFGRYLRDNTHVKYLFMGGCYVSDLIGGIYEI